ncbi:MFS transporter [Paenibacillus pinistramenti]|uniref:MFS transporter n=1 Tax=Paenibacillus pinistramenti TaxID=1768003 RepID=UPI001396AF19|nr:MFS transporter [Paenibacillus pinistramenti]
MHLLNFFTYGIAAIFTSYLPLYLMLTGLDKLEIGIFMSAGPLVSIAAYPFWNFFRVRQLGTRNVLLLQLTGILLCIHLMLWIAGYPYLTWITLLLFFFLSPLLYTSNTLSMEYAGDSPSELKIDILKSRYWASAGWAVLPLTASLGFGYAFHDGVLHPLPVTIVTTLIIAAAIGIGLSFPSIRKQAPAAPIMAREIIGVLMNQYFFLFLLLGMLITIPLSVNQLFMPLFISDLGGKMMDVALAVCASFILEAAVLHWLSKLNIRKMSRLLLFLTAVSLLSAIRWNLMAGATLPSHVIYISLLNSATLGGFFFVGTRLTSLFLPKPYRSAGQTLLVLCWSGLSAMAAGPLGGWLFQNLGSVIMYKTMVSMTLCGTIGLGLLWIYIHRNGYKPDRYYS